MAPGPAPTPTALRKLRGNPSHRAKTGGEPRPRSRRPPCPRWLNARARRIWKQYERPLHLIGLLTEIDGAVFAVFCQSFARWQEAEEAVEEHGLTFETEKGYVMQRPEVIISRNERRRLLDAAVQIGLTPSARSRFRGEKPPDPADALEAFLDEPRSSAT